MRRLVVRIDMPEGLHVYDQPVPDGMIATAIEVAGPEGVRFEPMTSPPTHPFSLPGIAEPLHVWDGTVDFVIPFFANSAIVPTLRSGASSITIEVSVRYQACDDQQCFLPQTRTIDLEVPIDFGVMPAFEGMPGRGATVIDMDSTAHMERLFVRKAAERPDAP
ncbi:MAG: protein-disulfide reductase DsbD domain-containing protein [Actinomycetota bacterium]